MRTCVALAAAGLVAAGAFAESVKIRGYGEIEASFAKNAARFRCATPETAEIVYAKLIRDIPGCAAAAPSGAYAVGLKDSTVYVLAGADEGAIEKAFAKDGVRRPAPKEYPQYLDYFDLKALKFYARPMDSFLNLGVENHWPFAKKVGIEGFVFHGIDFAGTKGPNCYSFQPWDFGVKEAEKNGGMVVLSPSFAGPYPEWVRDQFPEKCAKVQDHTLVTEWIQGVEGMPFDGDGPGFPPETSPQVAFEKLVIERYRDSPALGGWQFYCGKPIGDQFGPGMSGILWDASEEAMAMQRQWLAERYTLRDLSLRWTGRANAYRSWKDVPSQQLVDILGGDWDPDRLDLHDSDWAWAKAPEAKTWLGAQGWVEDKSVQVETPPPADVTWIPFNPPPSNRNNFLEQGRAWYRIRLAKSAWLAKNRGKTLYLRGFGYLMDGGRFTVWANGAKSVSGQGAVLSLVDAPIEAGTLRNDGTDEIVVEMPGGRCGGRFAGPVSLSPNRAENFPYRDKRTNARYLDVLRFQYDRLMDRGLKVYRLGRALDPNRPISLSGINEAIFSVLAPAWGENGFALQSTSTDGFYWPFAPDLGRQYGSYFIGEPSRDVAAEDRFDRNFGTIFYTGASSTAVFMDIEQYMDFETKTGGMSARKPITRLVGKYLVDEPRIALFFSSLGAFCTSGTPYSWNLARGEAQAVHYDTAMVNDRAFADGKADAEKYPLMLDCGADVMDAAMVDRIERYVRAGGTFVAFSETGRHTDLERDAHPFARLSGFRTSDFEGGNTEVKFADGETVFPAWAGKAFAANGYGKYTQANWRYNRMLVKTADDAEVLATWVPSGKPAAGVRRIGKGRVITLASGFWREAADICGKWVPSRYNELTDQLFAQLGATRNANADSFHVWTRKATSKNGLEDWLIAFNVALDDAQRPVAVTSGVSFRTDAKPARVFDAFTGADVAWTYEDGFVRIPSVEFGPYKTRIFAAAKPVAPTAGLPFWWEEKLRYWKKGPEIRVPDVRVPRADIVAFDDWEFSTAPEKGGWRKANNSTWKIQFPDLRDYKGPATYRAKFTLPADRKDERWVVRFGYRTIYDRAELLMNGKKFLEFDQAKVHRELCGDTAADVSQLLVFGGENVLEVRVTGGSKFTAGICDLIWMYPEQRLAETIDLRGDWTAVMKDFATEKPAKIPGANHCRYLKRTLEIPKSWAGRRIYLRVVYPENTIGAVVVNERSRNLPGCGHTPWGNREVLNVTDLVKPGETNTIELWHRHTIPVDWKGKAWGWPLESTLTIDEVVLGVAE